MLKPYKDRVLSTEAFMLSMIDYIEVNGQEIIQRKRDAINQTQAQKEIPVNWKLDKGKVDQLLFKGYEAKYKPSEISGADRLYYDRLNEFEKEIDQQVAYLDQTLN